MKKISVLSLLISSLICFSCNSTTQVNVNPSSSPSASIDPSASVSPSSSINPSSSVNPSTSPTPTVSSVPVKAECIDLVVGQSYDATVFSKYCPPIPKVGTKWVYNFSGLSTTYDTSVEVTAVQGDSYTIHTKGPSLDQTTQTKNTGYQDVDSSVMFKYTGTEDVNVGAGSYPASAKLTTSTTKSGVTTNLTYWLAKNVGVVKVNSDSATAYGTISALVTLKSFTP